MVRYRHGDVVNFTSHDYLGFTGDARLVRAAARGLQRYGVSSAASPIRSGCLAPLQALERDLAAWEGYEAALVFSNEMVRDQAVVSTIAAEHDAIYCDAGNQSRLIDAARLSKASLHFYPHNDLDTLIRLIREHNARHRFIVSESVFGGNGDLADLAGLLHVARQADALVVLDESHATGVLGEHGRGLTDQIAHEPRIIKLGSLSKALGSDGAYVCASRQLIDWLIVTSRQYQDDNALSPAHAAAARRAIFLIAEEPARRQAVLALAELLREALGESGVPCNDGAHIVSCELPRAAHLVHQLADRFLISTNGPSELVVRLCSGHTQEDVAQLVAALGETECR